MIQHDREIGSPELTPEQHEVETLLSQVDFDKIFADIPEEPISERISLFRYFVGTKQSLAEEVHSRPYPHSFTTFEGVTTPSLDGTKDTFQVSRKTGRSLGLLRNGVEKRAVQLSVKGVGDNTSSAEITIDTDRLEITGSASNNIEDSYSLDQAKALDVARRILNRLGLLENVA